MRKSVLLNVLFLLVPGYLCFGETLSKVHEIAQKRVMPQGAPKYSDVLMRSLHIHPSGPDDPYDTVKMVKAFHVTRLEWTYFHFDRLEVKKDSDSSFLEKISEQGCKFGNAICSIDASNDNLDNTVKDLKGNPITPPWMRIWTPQPTSTCASHPKTVDSFVNILSQRFDMGVNSVQIDDPDMNAVSYNWGSCFCEYCVEGFTDYLRRKKFSEAELKTMGIETLESFNLKGHLEKLGAAVGDHSMQDKKWNYGLKKQFIRFQEEAVQNCMEEVRKRLEEKYGKVTLSMNNGSGRWPFYHRNVYDYGIGEFNVRNLQPEKIYKTLLEIIELKKAQVFTMIKGHTLRIPEDEPNIRRFIAFVYACGGQAMMPWDNYLYSTPEGSKRYYGKPSQYADLSGFIRGAAWYFDDYEIVGAYGHGIHETAEKAPVIVHQDIEVTAVVRAQPGKADAPVVIHLVNWSDDMRPAGVILNPKRFFSGNDDLKVTLLTPKPYNAAVHEQSQACNDFSLLVETHVLARGGGNLLKVPGLDPWGVLVVEKPGSGSKKAWTPVIEPFGGTFIGSQEVRLAAISQAEVIYFTTDGSEPDKNSQKYSGPVTVSDSRLFKAVAYKGNEKSDVVSCLFRKVSDDELIKAARTAGELKKGLKVSAVEGVFDELPDFSKLKADAETTVGSTTQISYAVKNPQQAFEANGYVKIEKSGLYNFQVYSNNKLMETKIFIDGRVAAHIVNNHHLICKELPLEEGMHKLRILHRQRHESDNYFPVYMEGPAHPYGVISWKLLYHEQ